MRLGFVTFFSVALFGTFFSSRAQFVSVTMTLDTNRLAVGSSTTLRVYAHILPEKRASTEQIFSWYVDLLNSNVSVAGSAYDQLQKPASDQHADTSSPGVTTGANRHGIYDTFINFPGAGRNSHVELLSVPVQALASGTTTFRVQPGTGVPALMHDFIVAPAGGGEPLVGGVYDLATSTLEVSGSGTRLQIDRTPLPDGKTRLTISYPVAPGQNVMLEARSSFNPGTAWEVLPGGSHNGGTVIETNSVQSRFYRLRIAN